jgi:benzoylformate decarboxylase
VRAEQICDDAARALKVAGTAPMGPVFLCYPEDLLAEEVRDARPRAGYEPLADASASAQRIAAIENMWSEAARPVLIAGDEVSATGAVEVLLRVAERHGTPILQEDRRSAVSWNVPTDHPLYAGMYSPQHPVVAAADLVIGLGCRLVVEFSPSQKPALSENAALIHVHRDAWEVGKLYAADLGVVASTRLVLEALWESCKQHPAKSPYRLGGQRHRLASVKNTTARSRPPTSPGSWPR